MQCKKIKTIHVHDLITNGHYDFNVDSLREDLRFLFGSNDETYAHYCDEIADFYTTSHDAACTSSYEAQEKVIETYEHKLGIFTFEN